MLSLGERSGTASFSIHQGWLRPVKEMLSAISFSQLTQQGMQELAGVATLSQQLFGLSVPKIRFRNIGGEGR
jgi:hypothetical protein